MQRGQNGPFVYVVGADDTASVRLVTIDRTVDGLSVIAKGLQAGERVITDGQLRVFPGAAVTYAKPAAGAAPAEAATVPAQPKSGS